MTRARDLKMTLVKPQTLAEAVAANVRAETARRQITQAQIALAVGIKQQLVSDRLRGRTPWRLDELEALAAMLRMPVERLLARPEGLEPPTF